MNQTHHSRDETHLDLFTSESFIHQFPEATVDDDIEQDSPKLVRPKNAKQKSTQIEQQLAADFLHVPVKLRKKNSELVTKS